MGHRFIVLNEDERAALFEDVVGQGGFQSLLRRLQKQYRPGSQELLITDEDLEQIQSYAFDCGQGGWENRLKATLSRELGPNLGRE